MTASSTPAGDGDGRTHMMGSTNDLAADTPGSLVDRVLRWVPRFLSSKPHVIALMVLGVYLIAQQLIR